MNMIPKTEIKALSEAIRDAVNKHGHPDSWDLTEGTWVEVIETSGVTWETLEKAFALLTSETFPTDEGEAVAKWLRLIGEFSE